MEFFAQSLDNSLNRRYNSGMEKKHSAPHAETPDYDYDYYHINATVTTDVFPVDVGHQAFTVNHKPFSNKYPYYLLHLVAKGKGGIEINGKKHAFAKNDVFVLPPNTDITYYPDPVDPWENYWINFNGAVAKNILSQLGIDDTVYYVSKGLPAAKKYFAAAMQAQNNLASRVFTVQSCLFGVFALIAETNRKIPPKTANNEKLLFSQILEYVTVHLCDKDLSANDTAALFFISPAYFSRLFKKHMNVSFKSYVNYERVKKATELMETSNLYIKNVGFAVGFSDPLYFGKVFKKYRLYSPNEYKKRLSDNKPL